MAPHTMYHTNCLQHHLPVWFQHDSLVQNNRPKYVQTFQHRVWIVVSTSDLFFAGFLFSVFLIMFFSRSLQVLRSILHYFFNFFAILVVFDRSQTDLDVH